MRPSEKLVTLRNCSIYRNLLKIKIVNEDFKVLKLDT